MVLLVVPYLCFAVIGEMPHEHGQSGSSSLPYSVAAGLTNIEHPCHTVGNIDIAGGQCPLCLAQASLSACASPSMPVYLLPGMVLTQSMAGNALTIRTLLLATSSRAPPQAHV